MWNVKPAKYCVPQLPRQFGEGERLVCAWDGLPKTRTLLVKQRTNKGCTQQSPRQDGAAGFTLLEVMVALAIVAIALVPLLRLHLLSLDATVRAQSLTRAILLAQEQLALLPAFPEPGEEKGGFDDPDLAAFRWQSVVTENEVILGASAQLIKLRHIELTVWWVEGQREYHYTLDTYVAQ